MQGAEGGELLDTHTGRQLLKRDDAAAVNGTGAIAPLFAASLKNSCVYAFPHVGLYSAVCGSVSAVHHRQPAWPDNSSLKQHMLMLPPYMRMHPSTDEECCGRLEEIGFSSNLPTVIVDTFGVALTRDKINASLCTCSTLPKGDYNGDVKVSLRGGDNTRERPGSSSLEQACL